MIDKHLFLFAERKSWPTGTHLYIDGQLTPTPYLYREGYGQKLKGLFNEETCDNVDHQGPKYSAELGNQCLASLRWIRSSGLWQGASNERMSPYRLGVGRRLGGVYGLAGMCMGAEIHWVDMISFVPTSCRVIKLLMCFQTGDTPYLGSGTKWKS